MTRHSAAKILWLDLEMTGLDPVKDRIMEVGMIATDWDFQAVATLEAVVKVSPTTIKRRMLEGPSAAFFAQHTDTRDQLIEQNAESGRPAKEVEAEIIDFIHKNFADDQPVLLAGNSIHMDRQFIAREWPNFDKLLHYRMLDVSAWKVVFEGRYRKKYAKPEAHRAMTDIQGSIEELKYYLGKIKL
ncbi:oligoribonuclease [Candidatus Saccharibacteria bacterium 32-49-12]|nr:MAG: oligoribonuclease [Candidatus Saccharibacteria bacterium 32-49-12]